MKDIKIKTKSWDHVCGDGCCTSYGTDVWINGEKVSQGEFDSIDEILREVLEYLEFNVITDED